MYTLSNLNFMGKSPKIDPDAFVAPRVFLAGDVRISRYASLWPGVVARGDVNYISIGECSNVQDWYAFTSPMISPASSATMSPSATAPAYMPARLKTMSSLV